MGWWCWPKEMKLYRGGDAKTRERMLCDRESSEAIQLLKETFMSETFWAKHLKYASQETTPSQQSASQRLGEGAPEENFSYTMARYYAAVFQLFEDDFFYAHIAPTLETWMRASEKSHVRAAAEIVAGVVRGMKHWPWAKQQRFWSWFMPLLKHALGEANMDTIPLWNSFFFWIW